MAETAWRVIHFTLHYKSNLTRIKTRQSRAAAAVPTPRRASSDPPLENGEGMVEIGPI